ncbi:hypothetical protein ACKFKG_29880 [Phormidesmis sp. 146-35]
MVSFAKVALPILALGLMFTTPQIASAKFLANNGSGGYYDRQTGRSHSYEFELWANDNNSKYTLKVWRSPDYPNKSPIKVEYFRSAGEALNFFDKNYTDKSCDLWRAEGVCSKSQL